MLERNFGRGVELRRVAIAVAAALGHASAKLTDSGGVRVGAGIVPR